MYPGDLASAITDTFEPKFGLNALMESKCVISPDTPEDVQNYLSAATFQSMCTGEIMSTVAKYKTAKSEVWKQASIWASNQPGKWPDKAGAIYRRVMYFLFQKLVKVRDTTLKARIITNELPVIFIRCILTYFSLLEEVGPEDVWSHVPSCMTRVKENLAMFTNPLEDFIRNGSDFYQIIFKQGSMTPLSQLEQAFSNFMKFGIHKKHNASIGRDYYPLTKHGYSVETIVTCKVCCRPVNMANCGDHYDRLNRTRRVMVINMEIINTRSLPDNGPASSWLLHQQQIQK